MTEKNLNYRLANSLDKAATEITRERRKRTHIHQVSDTPSDGNAIRCRCGAIMGFLRDPKQARS